MTRSGSYFTAHSLFCFYTTTPLFHRTFSTPPTHRNTLPEDSRVLDAHHHNSYRTVPYDSADHRLTVAADLLTGSATFPRR